MNPLNRVGHAVKQFAMVFGNRTRGWWSMFLTRTRYDYAREVGDGRTSSLMQACVLWICRTFPEAPIRVCTVNAKGEDQPVDNHPLKLLMDTPNPYYPGELLWYATLADRTFTGNAYWLKVRSSQGRVVELWWVPSGMMEPRWPDDGSAFVSHYEYTPGTVPLPIDPRDVVHFRYGLDPHNMRKGLSPLASLLREIFTDDEAANYTASMLRNVGVPPLVISPGADAHPTRDEMQETKQGIIDRTTGDRRGEPMVFDGPTEVKVLGFNPQQMDVKALRRIPEERVSAVLGIPAAVVGLGTGLENTKVGATMAEMREQAYESNIIPTQRLMTAELRTQLLTEFGDVRSLKLEFDLSKVRVLQVDQDALHSRAREDLNAGLITLSRAQEMIGEEPDPNGAVYYLPGTVTPTDPGELLAPPAPAPTLALPPGAAPVNSLPPAKMYRLPTSRKGLADVDLAIMRLRVRLRRMSERTVGSVLDQQQQAVISNLLDGSKDVRKIINPDNVVPHDSERVWTTALAAIYVAALDGMHGITEDVLETAFGLPERLIPRYLAEAGVNIAGINQTTLQAVRAALQAGIGARETVPQLAARIRDLPEFGTDRAMTIARTELAQATNLAAVHAYRASGVVVGVRVSDGDYDAECAAMNGRRFSLAEAPASLQHPNCQRVFSPITNAAELESAA